MRQNKKSANWSKLKYTSKSAMFKKNFGFMENEPNFGKRIVIDEAKVVDQFALF